MNKMKNDKNLKFDAKLKITNKETLFLDRKIVL
jgi:hypothetical protein